MTIPEASTIALFSLASYYVWDTSEAATSGPVKHFTLTGHKTQEYIESPNYPYDDYPNDALFVYRVEVKLNNTLDEVQVLIRVTFEVFLMESSSSCHKDSLDLVDTTGAMRSYCGPQSGRNFLMEGSLIALRMRTDATGRERGFRIRVELYFSTCGGYIYKDKGSSFLQSPNYGVSYGANTRCAWRIVTARNMRIILKFIDEFDIRSDNHDTCFMDYLEISRTGSFLTDSHRYCGNTIPRTVISKTHRALLKFVSDCCNEGQGFRLQIVVVPTYAIEPYEATHLYYALSCQIAACGAPQSHHFVVRHPVREGEYYAHKYPWMVAIFNHNSEYICAGSLIARGYVLTAAHCCINGEPLRVKIGVHVLTAGPFLSVEYCVMHPDYTKHGLVNDIAVLVLKKWVHYDEFQWNICLPVDAEDMPGFNGTIAGWSRESYGGRYKSTPEEFTLPFIPQSSCVEDLGAIVLTTNLCVGGGKKDACQGENGGPLMSTWHSTGKVLQMAIVTTGIGCGRKGHPGIYTRITPYHDFVYNITRQKWCSVRPRDSKRKFLKYNIYR